MGKLKNISLQWSEHILILTVLFYWFSSGYALNPIAIVLISGLIFQIVFKNRIVGIIIPSLLIMASLYMLLALLSELHEFPTFNADALRLLLIGSSYLTTIMVVSGLMIDKYSKMEK